MSDTHKTESLHDQIMRLPCTPPKDANINQALSYKSGHRDARHAAVELAAAHEVEQAAPVAVPDDWKAVPVDATGEMVEALKARIGVTSRGGILNAGHALNAAIAAAPTPPEGQREIPVAVPDEREAFEAWQRKGGHKRPEDAGEWEAWQARAALSDAPTPPEGPWESPCIPPAQQPSVFWVLFDATGPEKFIKKMMPEGFLAFFDNESDARRAKAQNPGTDFKRVEYYKAPPAQQSHVIRAAYEVLLGCIKRPEIAALIDTAGVEKIAKQLNNLLPGHGDTAAPEQAEHPHQVNRSVIRDVFLRNGFAIKEGHSDLKPYVYAAAEELLALDGKAVAAEQDAAKVPRKLLRHVCDWLFFHEYPLLQGDKSEGYRLATELRALLGGDA